MTPSKLPGLLAAVLLSSSSLFAAPSNLTEDQARHLLVRSGFAPTQTEVDRITGQSAQRVVTDIITRAKSARPAHPAPDFVSQPPPLAGRYLKTKDEQQAFRQQQLREGFEIKNWWMREMIETPVPLQERMTLFWHNHFATSQQKVLRSQAMWVQHQLLRNNALGNFRILLHAIAKDPAMLVYLDGANSRREAPNENFAREVMELFTLGEASQGGGYTEADIKEAARAFTGWSVDRETFRFMNRPNFHDNGSKTLLGHSGNLDGDAALDAMLDQPAAPRFIVTKLWKEFVSPAPDVVEVERIARRFRNQNFDIAVAVKELLLTDAFWSPESRGSLIKSPVDLVVGTVRQFGFSYSDVAPFALKSAQLGQNLLFPPNVKGWPGYTDWINATTLLERKRFGEQLFRAVEPQRDAKLSMAMAPDAGDDPATPMGKMTPRAKMMAEFAGGEGKGSNKRALGVMGREGVMRVANAVSSIRFDPDPWLALYGGHADREPSDESKARLTLVMLASPATQNIATGTVGVAYIRTLTLDPAYQLK